MNDIQLGTVESKFADIIWSNEPVTSARLVELSLEQLQWKKSTTFTVLRRLCDKGLFQNVNGTVTSLISKSEFYAMQSEQFVENTFEGSLPAFLAAFTTRKNLKPEEVAEIRRMISEYGEE
ncbi:MAG: BlaI/MecI/CopY family transcriptional regulator [Ruminococcaceae bacterium]|nr:BlaI/MecI/CopY family transcriptional regulator [Oscillospiraceae bacterium]